MCVCVCVFVCNNWGKAVLGILVFFNWKMVRREKQLIQTHTHTHTQLYTQKTSAQMQKHIIWKFIGDIFIQKNVNMIQAHFITHTHTHIPPVHESSCWLTEECVCVLPLSLFWARKFPSCVSCAWVAECSISPCFHLNVCICPHVCVCCVYVCELADWLANQMLVASYSNWLV